MPFPTAALATLRPDISGSMEKFDLAMDRQGFIGLQVFPVFEVNRPFGEFGLIPLEILRKVPETRRAPRAPYARGDWKFAYDTFQTVEYGWEEPVDEKEATMYEDYFDAEFFAAEMARDVVARGQESRHSAALFNPTVWTGADLFLDVTNEWSDYGNATPIDDVEFAIRQIRKNSGLWANAVVMNRIVFRNLRLCDQIIDRIAGQGSGGPTKPTDITPAQIAACFDIEKLIIADGLANTANDGQSADLSDIWSEEYVSVCRVARTRNIKEPCVGRTMHWGADGSQIGGLIEDYGDPSTRSHVVRCRHEVQEKRLYTEAAFLLGNITEPAA